MNLANINLHTVTLLNICGKTFEKLSSSTKVTVHKLRYVKMVLVKIKVCSLFTVMFDVLEWFECGWMARRQQETSVGPLTPNMFE